ncbi:hypothetical protein AAZX31_10G098000 [Glycine max]
MLILSPPDRGSIPLGPCFSFFAHNSFSLTCAANSVHCSFDFGSATTVTLTLPWSAAPTQQSMQLSFGSRYELCSMDNSSLGSDSAPPWFPSSSIREVRLPVTAATSAIPRSSFVSPHL